MARSLAQAAAVTLGEFKDVLASLLSPMRGVTYPRRLGLAVSGGVDSMALAYLCRELQEVEADRYSFLAMVVDHCARPASSTEAQHVAASLKTLGLQSRVLTLQWPTSTSPLQLNDFETQARRLRYQALGSTCFHHHINDLLVAHHNDDQAETVLMRIATKRAGMGLKGIRNQAPIPECYGMFGVHESGVVVGGAGESAATITQQVNRTIGTTDGGIVLHRPLLNFSKDRLQATCKKANLTWTEDESNSDRTLTLRNAIRHMAVTAKLPVALRKESLLHLCAAKQKDFQARSLLADNLVNQIDIILFDLRSGRIVVQFAADLVLKAVNSHILHPSSNSKLQPRLAASALLEQICHWVTPLAVVSTEQMGKVTKHMFANLEGISAISGQSKQCFSFTGADINWEVTRHSTEAGQSRLTLKLSRQPFRKIARLPRCEWRPDSWQEGSWSHWQLFDGRFWLRIRILEKRHHRRLIARPLCERDLKGFNAGISDTEQKRLKRCLAIAAPGKIRWTLPALADDITGSILALPTIGFALKEELGQIQWQSMYRKIAINGRQKGAVEAGISVKA